MMAFGSNEGVGFETLVLVVHAGVQLKTSVIHAGVGNGISQVPVWWFVLSNNSCNMERIMSMYGYQSITFMAR